MRITLFDQNLSFKLCTLLSDLFPDSKAVREQHRRLFGNLLIRFGPSAGNGG
jgi:hypothetical protein